MKAIVMERGAPSVGGYGNYCHVAAVVVDPEELDGAAEPSRIDERVKGCVEILWDSGRVNRGKTARSAAARARKEAEFLADHWNRTHA